MRVRPGKTIACEPIVCVHSQTRRAPVRDFVGTIRNAPARDRRVENNRIESRDFHGMRTWKRSSTS